MWLWLGSLRPARHSRRQTRGGQVILRTAQKFALSIDLIDKTPELPSLERNCSIPRDTAHQEDRHERVLIPHLTYPHPNLGTLRGLRCLQAYHSFRPRTVTRGRYLVDEP